MQAGVDVVIVNWNTGGSLRRCVDSVLADAGAGVSVIVVDNASVDGSMGLLPSDPRCVVARNAENRGFAAACNQGAAMGNRPMLLFLNPDVRLDPHALTAAIEFMTDPQNGDVGIVGVQLRDESGAVQRSCARFPTAASMAAQIAGLDRVLPRVFRRHFLREWDHGETRAVDQVMGAFFLVRRELFEQLGGFDCRFFVYYEDLDFSLRARRAGWKSVYLASAGAVHTGGLSSAQVPASRLFYKLRSRTRYAQKHFGMAATALLLCLTVTVEPLLRLLHAAAVGRPGGAGAVLRGYLRFLCSGAGLRGRSGEGSHVVARPGT